MRPAAILVLLLALAFVLVRHWAPAPPPPAPTPAAAAAPDPDGPWWPTPAGATWDYRVTAGVSPYTTRRYVCVGPQADAVVIHEYSDGRQTDAFTVRAAPAGGFLREFRAAKTELVYLPAGLDAGSSWELRADLRARAAAWDEVTVPAFPEPRRALRIEYEARYDEGRTKDPGWYPDGVRWFARGVGLIQEDLRDARAPRELDALVAAQRRLLVLTGWTPGGR